MTVFDWKKRSFFACTLVGPEVEVPFDVMVESTSDISFNRDLSSELGL